MNERFEQRLPLWVLFAAFSAFLGGTDFQPDAVRAATLASQEQAAQVVSIRNITVKDGVVSGELVNQSPNTVRDVQLLIRYTWLWKDEMHPGEDTRGDAVYYTVEGDIPRGGSKPFTYRPGSAMASGAEGRFEVAVSIAGFAQVIPQK